MQAPLDVLAVAAHPDDAELHAGGTLCLLAKQGYRTGIVDLTRGELATRGTPILRRKEAERASAILGLTYRHNLAIPDGGITRCLEHRMKLVSVLRQVQPRVVLLHPMECRHPDHTSAARLTLDACFYSGLEQLSTGNDTVEGPWRPHHLLHYAEVPPMKHSFVVDVSQTWAERMRALRAYESQFYNADHASTETFISKPSFLRWIEARAKTLGFAIGAEYGEAFQYRGTLGVTRPMELLFGSET